MPKSVDHDQRRTHVIAATRRVLARDGLARLSMRAIAVEADCTTGLVTHYFADKQHLVSEAMADTARAQAERARKHFRGQIADAAEVLAELLPLDRNRGDETRVWLAFYAQAIGDEDLLAQHQQHYAQWRAIVSDGLRTLGVENSRIATATERLVIDLNGLAVQGVLDPGYWTPERQYEQLRCILAEALRAKTNRQ